MKQLDSFKGCLLGGAIGDALGYSVEFLNINRIKEKYGDRGITKFVIVNDKALVSDDTQMTLFTANGLLYAATRGNMRGIYAEYEKYVYAAYKDWFYTQESECLPKDYVPISWIYNIDELHERRAPGNTCLSALSGNNMGTLNAAINDSKGCGGVMRVAPVGLYFSPLQVSQREIAMLGAKVSAITHGHMLSHMSSYVMTLIINKIVYEEKNDLYLIVNSAMEMAEEDFYKYEDDWKYFKNLIYKALDLVKEDIDDISAIQQLGEGWVAEEALAIAIFSALRYSNDFEKAVICSVNHSGDSDSTGAITGNILGAYLGENLIPNHFLEKLELKNEILEIAKDLFIGCPVSEYSEDNDPNWIKKYVNGQWNKKLIKK